MIKYKYINELEYEECFIYYRHTDLLLGFCRLTCSWFICVVFGSLGGGVLTILGGSIFFAGTQYCDGLRGPLVIYDPDDPQQNFMTMIMVSSYHMLYIILI